MDDPVLIGIVVFGLIFFVIGTWLVVRACRTGWAFAGPVYFEPHQEDAKE